MNAKDNTVNMGSSKGGYHHGDLRVALIETGLRRLEQGSAESLSLREIARDIGVIAISRTRTRCWRRWQPKGWPSSRVSRNWRAWQEAGRALRRWAGRMCALR